MDSAAAFVCLFTYTFRSFVLGGEGRISYPRRNGLHSYLTTQERFTQAVMGWSVVLYGAYLWASLGTGSWQGYVRLSLVRECIPQRTCLSACMVVVRCRNDFHFYQFHVQPFFRLSGRWIFGILRFNQPFSRVHLKKISSLLDMHRLWSFFPFIVLYNTNS